MKNLRFKKRRRISVPVSAVVVAAMLPVVCFFVPVYAAVVSNGGSLGTGLHEMFAYVACNAFWWKWIAEKIFPYAQ